MSDDDQNPGTGVSLSDGPVRNPDVEKISFTGSVAVGESIMRDGAATMKRVTLELGGKSPTILLDDADLGRAIPAALVLAFMNSAKPAQQERGYWCRRAG